MWIRGLVAYFLLMSFSSFAVESDVISLRLGAESQSLCTAFDCVNICNGEYFETHQEVAIDGPVPLAFTRCYESGQGVNRQLWKGNNQSLAAPLNLYIDGTGLLGVTEREGAFLLWQWDATRIKGTVSPQVFQWGYTNFGGGESGPSGRTHIRNYSLEYLNPNTIRVRLGSGALRIYQNAYQPRNAAGRMWLLQKEIRPDGHRVHYQYQMSHDEAVLTSIHTTNAAETLQFNSLVITRDPDRQKYMVRGSNGQTARYTLAHISSWWETRMKDCLRKRITIWHELPSVHLREVELSHGPGVVYTEDGRYELGYKKPNGAWLHITKRQGVDGRYLAIGYSEMDGRVMHLQAPLGTDDKPVTYARFAYRPTATMVFDAMGHLTTYQFGAQKRITAIENFSGRERTQALYSAMKFIWGNEAALQGNLLVRGLTRADGKYLFCAVGTYDDRGNVIQEDQYGNLTGNQPDAFAIGADHKPTGPTDCSTIRTTYSDDGFNLPLQETHSDGKVIIYRYLSGTNRLVAKLLGDDTRILSREFHQYDADGLLMATLIDDGSDDDPASLQGVNVRKMTSIISRREGPAVGLADQIVEKCWDFQSGAERQLRRTQYTYDAASQVVQEDIYDADDVLQYILTYVYDERGNLITKTDPLGRITHYTYDANKNKLSEQLIGEGYSTCFRYDYMNRLIAREEVHDGTRLVTSFCYDLLGNKVCEVDPWGNETKFVYDEFRRLIETIYPPQEAYGSAPVTPSVKKQYNEFHQCIATTDPNGHSTKTTYTIVGQPVTTTFPDGSQERREYNRNGTLRKHWHPNGHCTQYTYDVLGRPIEQVETDDQGTCLACSRTEYVGVQIARKIDALGVVTASTYDGAGRKIGEICGPARTEYEYDSLGRLMITRSWFGPSEADVTATIQEHDLLDRVVATRVVDASGGTLRKEAFTYDIQGNRTHHYVYSTESTCTVSEVRYDSRKQPIEIIDALGNRTQIAYDREFRNALGQRVLLKTTTDPLGQRTVVEHDARGRVVRQTVLDPLGGCMASDAQSYDAAGNLSHRLDDVRLNGKNQRVLHTAWKYDGCGRLTQLLEGIGTADERVTRRSYHSSGQLECIVLPDGVQLLHTYDALGRVASYCSTDHTVGYLYDYDAVGNLLSVVDTVHGHTTTRQYDTLRRIERELLGNSLSISYTYDAQGRMVSLTLPDQSSVAWRYKAYDLAHIDRYGADGAHRYSHRITSRDLCGRVLGAELIHHAGLVAQTFDALGRPLSICCGHFDEHRTYDAVGNCIARSTRDPHGLSDNLYRYDALYQLTDESGAITHRYQYDSLRNRVAKNAEDYTHNGLNGLVRAGAVEFVLDARGNVAQKVDGDGTTRYRYDALGRLTHVECGNDQTEYLYDHFHRLLSTKRTDADETRFLYAGQNEIGAVDPAGRIFQLRLLAEGRGAEIGAAIALELAGVEYAPIHDLTGNVAALVDRTGAVIESYRYSAFGEEMIFHRMNDSSCGNPWRFASKRKEDSSGLINFGRRYYAPEVGRWLTPDPLGYQEGPNLYAYVNNRPLTLIDLYGLFGIMPRNMDGRRYDFVKGEFYTRKSYRPSEARLRADRPYIEDATSTPFLVPGRRLDRVAITCTNGQYNRPGDSWGLGKYISDTHGGYEVQGLHNRSFGPIQDFFKSAAIKGFSTDLVTVNLQRREWKRVYGELSGENREIIHYAHSQAASIAVRARQGLSKEVSDAITIRLFGPSEIIPKRCLDQLRILLASMTMFQLRHAPMIPCELGGREIES